ncbi:hypothetical protein HanIR_Chr00c33g0912311 [Helianthus annuus]|nr:hypothetical protein HanIR_Chr00c33g0912311 [Helianthus annuus]
MAKLLSSCVAVVWSWYKGSLGGTEVVIRHFPAATQNFLVGAHGEDRQE